jgi:hypothetical protein
MNRYAGTFLIALATLALEICLTRLLSVTTWYHLAFFAISTAMLGMTAGAVTVYLKPRWFREERLDANIALSCVGFALATPITLIVLCVLPLSIPESWTGVVAVVLGTAFCCLPFYFSGVAIAAVLTKVPLPIGRLYASDLTGAALGCLAVLAGVEVLDVPSLILLFAAVGAAAGYCFVLGRETFLYRGTLRWVLVLLVVVTIVNATAPRGISPLVVKGKIADNSDQLYEEWNSFSRVVVHQGGWSIPQLWAASPAMPPQHPVVQFYMDVDGDAGTTIRRFSTPQDIQHLAYDVTNVGYYLRPRGGACVIGVGGGRDVQSALLFGHERILGIEVNPVFVRLLEEDFGEFAGLAGDSRVRLVVDEARSHLSRTDERFSVIQMSLIDTWAATGAGAFSLSENALYTVDAWTLFLQRLNDDGIFTVSRWYSPEDLGETGRVVSLAVASLLESGVADPAQHVAMVTTGRIATTLVAKRPFSDAEIARLREIGDRLGYDVVISPDVSPRMEVLRAIVSSRSPADLRAAVEDAPFNYDPPTDENPYFFNMLRLTRLPEAFRAAPGVARGNLTATVTLLVLTCCLTALAAATVVLPLTLKRRRNARLGRSFRISWAGVFYFSLIGAGFMFVEIALIQRLSVFLGHPVYALGILLFTLIASAGCGSLLSDRMTPSSRVGSYLLPALMAAAILGTRYALPWALSLLVASSMAVKIAFSVAMVFPLGVWMGLFFPLGMRLAKLGGTEDTPWYWALNGVFGVLSSALAVLFSIYFGISVTLYIAAACYAALPLCVRGMRRNARSGIEELEPSVDLTRETELPPRKVAV